MPLRWALDDALAQAPYVKAEGLTEKLHRGGAGEAGELYAFSDVMGDLLPLPSRLHLDLAEGCEGRVEKKQASLAACQAKEFGNEGGISNPKSTKVPFLGVQTWPHYRGHSVAIRPRKLKKKLWFGTFDSAEDVECAYDVANFLTRNDGKCNFPDLIATIPPMPSHLRFDSEKDTEEIKDFVQKQARLAAHRAAKYNGMKACATRPTPNEEIKNVETKPEVETAATQGRQQDAEVELEDVKAIVIGGFKMDQSLNGEARAAKPDHQSDHQSFFDSVKSSQYCSRAGSGRNLGVRTRKGVRGYFVEIRPPKWKKTIWLGTYNTAEEAACAYDAGTFLTGKNRKYNFPDLIATIPPMPSHLRFDSEKDTEEIKDFVQKQARLAAWAAENKGMKACGSRPTANEEIKNVETKPEVETAATQGRQQDAEVELEDVKANVIGGFKMDQSLNGEARAAKADHQSDNQSFFDSVKSFEFDDESGSDGSSSWVLQESKAEVTADSPCRETDSTNAGMERSRDPIDEETLISRLAPFMRKEVEEALNGTLLPLVSALRSREEEELKHREKMLALEVQKLALKREKLLFKRRRLARSQPQRRSSAAMARSASSRNGLQVKKNRPPQ